MNVDKATPHPHNFFLKIPDELSVLNPEQRNQMKHCIERSEHTGRCTQQSTGFLPTVAYLEKRQRAVL